MEHPQRISPDIFIADLLMPTVNKLELVTFIREWNPGQQVMVITDNPSPLQAIRVLRNGALGYIIRKDEPENLIRGIFDVAKGKRFVSELVKDQIMDAVLAGKNLENSVDERISSREREILLMIAEGKSTSEISRILVISKRTVETHRNNLMRKLGFSSQNQIVRYAIKTGILPE